MITTLLSTAINRLLQKDPTAKTRLNTLADKILTLHCKLPIPITLQCSADDNGINISLGDHLPSHTKIAGTPLQLFRVGLLQTNSDAFQVDDLQIEGDMELAENWLRLFREADIDLEEQLADIVGDIPAHRAGQLFHHIKTFVKRNVDSIETSLGDYLHEESDWFPTKDNLQDFFNNVDKTRLDTDRLHAKITLFTNELKDCL